MHYIEFTDYWIYKNNTIIIKPSFNDNIYLIDFNDNIKSLVFSDCEEIDNIIENIINNNYYNKTHIKSKFNYTVDNLPQGLLNLIFGISFNQLVDNLPQGL